MKPMKPTHRQSSMITSTQECVWEGGVYTPQTGHCSLGGGVGSAFSRVPQSRAPQSRVDRGSTRGPRAGSGALMRSCWMEFFRVLRKGLSFFS